MGRWAILACALLACHGCINISTKLQQDNPAIRADFEGHECAAILFGLGVGTLTIEGAMRNGIVRLSTLDQMKAPPLDPRDHRTIRAIRSIQFTDWQFLMFGSRCLEVIGE